MAQLEKNWITSPIIDAEYKQYVLLAYLKEIKASYQELKLYPHLSALIDQYCELLQLRDNQLSLADKFPKSLKGVDMQDMHLVFSNDLTEENWVQEITHTVEMAIPYVKEAMQEGKSIYEDIEKNIFMEPVGIEPLKNNEGYFILNSSGMTETLVYEYRVNLFETASDKYRAIHTRYTAAFVKSLSVTNYYIKQEMIRQHHEMVNPSVYAFDTDYSLPVEATYLPLVKRMLTRMAHV